jgi:hypothetical protein
MNWMKRAKDNPKSRTMAVKAFCYNCMGGTLEEEPDPGWKAEISRCTCPDCPLYNFRPYKGRVADDKE